tara:strand:- start:45 stop:863 length:819 start_codon:yes stop_codon:yes gene_type:complete
MNQLVGERLSIITPKAQTTRHRIMGIVNGEDYQIVFSDTPGIVDPAYKMHEGMMNFVLTAMQDADLFLVIVEVGEKKFKNEEIQERVNRTNTPTLVLVNKMDLSNQEELAEVMAKWQAEFPKADLLPISALHGFQVEQVMNWIQDKLPECPPYFPKDDLSDKTERFFASEMIREKIFLHYKKEIPYACEVVVEAFKEEEEIIRVRAEIFVERNSQKGILIGKNGEALKRVGTDARKEMEAFFQKKVFLELHVKVDKDWRSNPLKLKRYGYLN